MMLVVSYQLMFIQGVTHQSNMTGRSRPLLSVHPLQDAAPGG